MTITVDCRTLHASGVGVYLKGCLPWLLKKEANFILLGSESQLRPFLSHPNTTLLSCTVKPFSVRELFFFPRRILKQINQTDLFYSPFFNIPGHLKIPVFTTIHDIVFPDMPELTSRLGLLIRMFFFKRAYRRSKKIFTVSEFSKSRIIHHLGNKKPVIVTYAAVLPIFLDYTKPSNQRAKDKTIVFLGNIKKNKGLDCLVDAFSLAVSEGFPHKLIIIGEKDNFRSGNNSVITKIESLGLDNVLFTGYISDEKLMEYLSKASLLIQPSLYEGFCLPPLQALMLGTRALISDIPVLKEIYKDFPVTFFRAGDFKDLKGKMTTMLSETKTISLPGELRNKYSFSRTASIVAQNLNL